MGMTDQIFRETPAPVDSELTEIERLIARARDGSLTADEALEGISRIASRRSRPIETYQKPLG